PDEPAPGEDVGQAVEVRAPRQVHPGAGRDGRVQHRDGGGRDAGALVPVQVTGDDAYERAAVVAGQQGDLAGADVLVLRVGHLLRGGQVDPQLEAVEEAALDDEVLRRRLDVQQPGPGGHPLGVAVGDQAASDVGLLVV